nr:5'-nucleotidase C-terminal domain-containing protein [Paraglaciecola sp. 20A4]
MPVIDLPKVGGYPELASALHAYRNRNNASTFFLFGGNSLAPSPLSSLDRGTHIIDILNSLEPDAMAVTKREFSYFEDELSLRSYEAAFPMVASNIYDKRSEANVDGLLDTAIVEQRGVKIGVISVLDNSVISDYLLKHVIIRAPRVAIEQSAKRLREQNADIVVLMYSAYFPFIDELLDNKIVDITLTTSPELTKLSDEIMPTHTHAVTLGTLNQLAEVHIDFTDETSAEPLITWSIKELSSFPTDPIVEGQVKGYISRLNRLLNRPIAMVANDFQTYSSSVRTQENAFANTLADTIRTFANADIALINGGNIRGNRAYVKGQQLTRRDIAEELPFRSKVTVLNISGQQLKQALENGVSAVKQMKGRFPHVSGMKVTYDLAKASGERVISIKVADKPVQLSNIYKLATTDYLADGGDGYTVLEGCPRISLGYLDPPMIADIFIDSIQQQKTLGPSLDERLVNTYE